MKMLSQLTGCHCMGRWYELLEGMEPGTTNESKQLVSEKHCDRFNKKEAMKNDLMNKGIIRKELEKKENEKVESSATPAGGLPPAPKLDDDEQIYVRTVARIAECFGKKGIRSENHCENSMDEIQ